MSALKNLPLATVMVIGVLLFAFGASRLLIVPASNVAETTRHHTEQTQTAEYR